jgi:hypothetical protein
LPGSDVAAADGGGDDLDADLHGPRRGDLHLLHDQRLARPPGHRSCARAIQFYSILIAAARNGVNKPAREVRRGGLVPRQVMAAGGDEDAAAAAIRFSEVGAGAAALLCEVGVTCED